MDKRETRSFDDDEQIDLEDLTGGISQPLATEKQRKAVKAVAERSKFSSREPKKRRKVSPYTAQFGGKCRESMKDVFQGIGEHMGWYDTETLERAILALIEKEGLEDLKKKYIELVK
jgi:hypothetical protein